MTAIRPMRIEDYELVTALWRLTPEFRAKADDGFGCLRNFLARNPGLSQVAIAPDLAIVGTVLAGTDGRRGYLYRLAVHPTARRRGIGRRLVSAAVAALRASGLTAIRATIVEDNLPSILLHESLGFSARRDRVVVALDLNDADAN